MGLKANKSNEEQEKFRDAEDVFAELDKTAQQYYSSDICRAACSATSP